MNIIAKISDAITLGILWLVCSIPIVTLGASTTAFYYAYNKAIREGRGYTTKEFFYAFKTNFKQSTIMWLVIAGMEILFVADIFILNASAEGMQLATISMAILMALVVFVLIVGLFVFPYIARFECDTKTIVKNVLFIIITNFIWGVVLLIVFGLLVFLTLSMPVFGVLAPTIYMFVANNILERIFKKYTIDIE